MRGILLAAAILCGVVLADKEFNDDRLIDGASAMFWQIARSFGF
jgi:hypothetical protein